MEWPWWGVVAVAIAGGLLLLQVYDLLQAWALLLRCVSAWLNEQTVASQARRGRERD